MNIPKARELWGSGGNSDSQRSLDFEHGQFGEVEKKIDTACAMCLSKLIDSVSSLLKRLYIHLFMDITCGTECLSIISAVKLCMFFSLSRWSPMILWYLGSAEQRQLHGFSTPRVVSTRPGDGGSFYPW